uniref:beta-ketoacyl reductase n=1 Tax=Actinomadura sp. TaxID=1989 RepID=UPI0037C61495
AVLTALAQQITDEDGQVFAPAMRRSRPQTETLLTALATLWANGSDVHWPTLFTAWNAQPDPDLPTYPFQHEWYWLEGRPGGRTGTPADELRYRIEWQTVPEPKLPENPGTWLIVADETTPEADLRALADSAKALAIDVHLLRTPASGPPKSIPADAARADGVISTLTEPAHVSALLDTLIGSGVTAPLWTLTRSAVAAVPGDRIEDIREARVWGLGRSETLDRPGRWGGVVDLPAGPLDGDRIWAVVAAQRPAGDAAESELAVRGDALYARRMVRAGRGGPPGELAIDTDGTVLVTVDDGPLARDVIRMLAEAGVRHLLLVPAGDPAGLELPETGETDVTVAACDTADRAALAALLAVPPAGRPLTAVVHMAGGSPEDRLAGAVNLHELTLDAGLSAFVLFSSADSVWGGIGRGAVAAADAALEALAAQRHAAGLPATCLAWGPCAGAEPDGTPADSLRSAGLPPMPEGFAAAALRRSLGDLVPFAVIADIDWSRLAPLYAETAAARLFSGVGDAETFLSGADAAGAGDPAAAESLRRRLGDADPEAREAMLLDLVRAETAEVLGRRGAESVPPAEPFQRLGMDSLMGVELRNRLTSSTGLKVPATLVYDHPAPAAVARFLLDELLSDLRVAGADPVADLDRLEAAVLSLPPGGDELRQIAGRLRALLGQVDSAARAQPAADPGDGFESASADEMLALIQKEFRNS